MFDHDDALRALDQKIPLSDKLLAVHRVLRRKLDFIDRIAVAVYDPRSDTLKTYAHSSGSDDPLSRYEARLGDAPSLRDILAKGRPRVVNDLASFGGGHEHTRRIRAQGYGSSYTLPIYLNGNFFGYLFFNAYRKGVFDDAALSELDVFGHLISLAVASEVSEIRTLLASVRTASDMVHQRDFETGSHLDRMSNYAKLIAKELAASEGFGDEIIEHIFLFSVLHDVGKIGIPDGILLKNGKLSEAEFAVMKTHALKGREIIDAMLRHFGLEDLQHIDVLRNIAHHHHEAMDGSGYPDGLRGGRYPHRGQDRRRGRRVRRPHQPPPVQGTLEQRRSLRQPAGDRGQQIRSQLRGGAGAQPGGGGAHSGTLPGRASLAARGSLQPVFIPPGRCFAPSRAGPKRRVSL